MRCFLHLNLEAGPSTLSWLLGDDAVDWPIHSSRQATVLSADGPYSRLHSPQLNFASVNIIFTIFKEGVLQHYLP